MRPLLLLLLSGIEEAQAELQKETEQQLWEEGLIRHIPVVGSLVNYFLPAQKTGIKGRTLNLQSGRVEKSDIIVQTQHPAEQ
jgi:hypothetical protein